MANQQPRPPWFRFPFTFRTAGAAPVTQPSAPRAPPSPQPQPALVRPAPPPVASPPAAPITRPPAPRTAPPPQLQPTLVRPAPPPVASPPPAVAPAAPAPPSPLPSVPRPQTATPTPRSPVAPTTAPPRSPVAPTSAPRRSPVPPPPAPVASPPPAVAPAATPAPLPPSISRTPVASPTASPPPRSPAVSPTKYPIVKTSVSLPPSPAPEESQRTSTNIPFLSSIPASPKTKDQVPSPSKPTPVLQKSMLHSPTPTARKASSTGSPPEVAKLLERTPVQSTPIKPVSDKGLHKKLSESEEYRMRVITLAGKNKGAVMELSASGPQSLDKNGKIKTWRNGEKSSSVEGKYVEDKTCDEMVMESPQMTAFLNSNVQGINNSIFHNCSSTHNDPGIHLSLSRKKDQ